MDLKIFRDLDPNEQNELIFDFAVKIEERSDNIYRYDLYNFFSLYVEKKVSIKLGFVQETIVFEPSSKILEPYIDNIDLSEIYLRK
jgi:hypothetical protein